MKRKIIILAIVLISLTLAWHSQQSKKALYKRIQNGDSKETVINIMGTNYIDESSHYTFKENNHLKQIYCWTDHISTYSLTDSFPYLTKVIVIENYIVHFESGKVINHHLE